MNRHCAKATSPAGLPTHGLYAALNGQAQLGRREHRLPAHTTLPLNPLLDSALAGKPGPRSERWGEHGTAAAITETELGAEV
jgi:hypothetical protein